MSAGNMWKSIALGWLEFRGKISRKIQKENAEKTKFVSEPVEWFYSLGANRFKKLLSKSEEPVLNWLNLKKMWKSCFFSTGWMILIVKSEPVHQIDFYILTTDYGSVEFLRLSIKRKFQIHLQTPPSFHQFEFNK